MKCHFNNQKEKKERRKEDEKKKTLIGTPVLLFFLCLFSVLSLRVTLSYSLKNETKKYYLCVCVTFKNEKRRQR